MLKPNPKSYQTLLVHVGQSQCRQNAHERLPRAVLAKGMLWFCSHSGRCRGISKISLKVRHAVQDDAVVLFRRRDSEEATTRTSRPSLEGIKLCIVCSSWPEHVPSISGVGTDLVDQTCSGCERLEAPSRGQNYCSKRIASFWRVTTFIINFLCPTQLDPSKLKC